MRFLRYYLWIAPHVLLAVLLAGLLYRRLHRQLPVFTAYIIFEILQFLVSIVLFMQSSFPRLIYRWTVAVFGNGIGTLLELAVLYGIANHLLLSRLALAGLLRSVFRGALALLVLAAAIASGALFNISYERVTNVFETLDFASSLISTGMLLTLLILSRFFRISWASWAAGIALGFGILGSINLTGAALRAELGTSVLIAADITYMAAVHVCVVIWLVYVFRVDPVPKFANTVKQSDLEVWDQEMQRMVQR